MNHQPSDFIRENIYARVDADLRPSTLAVHLKIAISILLGGFLSLFLCGQMGFGLSTLAMATHQALMTSYGAVGCTIICGVVFAVVPVGVLRAMTRAMEFRVLIRRKWPVSIFWILICGGLIFVRNGQTDEIGTLLLWAAAAMASFAAVSHIIDRSHAALSRSLAAGG